MEAEQAPLRRPRRKGWVIWIGVAIVVLGAGTAGGVYVMRRNADPAVRAAQAEARGDLRTALVEWRSAAARDPKDPAYPLHVADVQARLFDNVAAEKSLRLAAGLGADRWDVLLRLGRAYVAQRRWSSVLSEMPRSAPSPSMTAEFLMMRGIAQLATNDVAAARTTLGLAKAADPDRAETILLDARIDLADGDAAGAEAKLDRALGLSPARTDALLVKAQLMAARGDIAGAEAVVDKAVASAPFDPVAMLDRANLRMVLGQDEAARSDVSSVLARLPGLPGAIILRAFLDARAGRDKEAWAGFEKVEKAVDAVPRALYVQAVVAAKLGNIETALQLAQRYVVRDPGDPNGPLLVAGLQTAARRPDLAASVLERAVAAGQRGVPMLSALGGALAAIGEDAESLRVRSEAVRVGAQGPVAAGCGRADAVAAGGRGGGRWRRWAMRRGWIRTRTVRCRPRSSWHCWSATRRGRRRRLTG